MTLWVFGCVKRLLLADLRAASAEEQLVGTEGKYNQNYNCPSLKDKVKQNIERTCGSRFKPPQWSGLMGFVLLSASAGR